MPTWLAQFYVTRCLATASTIDPGDPTERFSIMARVALVFNLITAELLAVGPLDSTAELDSEHTISALAEALESRGHTVVPINADDSIAEMLKAVKPQIVFNIAEGIRGESRESQVPALCEMSGIPYTGSGVQTLAICLDKARTKQILAYYGIPTAAFQIFRAPEEPLDPRLRFPLIIKLLHEGSSMGLSQNSVVDDEQTLRRQVAYLHATYQQPILVEEFIAGREFTVAVLGNDDLRVLPIIEYIFNRPRGIVLFTPDDTVLPVMRQARPELELPFGKSRQELEQSPQLANHYTVCPAEVSPKLKRQIEETALATYRALGVRDWGRMEMRLGSDRRLYILEVNPIAGIDPSYMFPKAARAAGMSYAELVNTILDYALRRAGLPCT
jgi:D-alanine-D-alanine ligase